MGGLHGHSQHSQHSITNIHGNYWGYLERSSADGTDGLSAGSEISTKRRTFCTNTTQSLYSGVGGGAMPGTTQLPSDDVASGTLAIRLQSKDGRTKKRVGCRKINALALSGTGDEVKPLFPQDFLAVFLLSTTVVHVRRCERHIGHFLTLCIARGEYTHAAQSLANPATFELPRTRWPLP